MKIARSQLKHISESEEEEKNGLVRQPINGLAMNRSQTHEPSTINRLGRRTNALWVHSGCDKGIIHIAKWSKQTIHMFVHKSDAMG